MNTVSISEAKRSLGRLADRAIKGKPSLIIRGTKLLVLQTYDMPEPFEKHPVGYYGDYDEDEITLESRLAKKSPRGIIK